MSVLETLHESTMAASYRVRLDGKNADSMFWGIAILGYGRREDLCVSV